MLHRNANNRGLDKKCMGVVGEGGGVGFRGSITLVVPAKFLIRRAARERETNNRKQTGLEM